MLILVSSYFLIFISITVVTIFENYKSQSLNNI